MCGYFAIPFGFLHLLLVTGAFDKYTSLMRWGWLVVSRLRAICRLACSGNYTLTGLKLRELAE